LLSTELGRPVTYVRQSLLERRAELRTRGNDPAYVWVQSIIDVTTQLGLVRKVTGDVPSILGRPATPLVAVHARPIAARGCESGGLLRDYGEKLARQRPKRLERGISQGMCGARP